MNVDGSEEGGMRPIETALPEPEARKAWTRPSLSQLAAGSAENIPGSVSPDGTLETIGS